MLAVIPTSFEELWIVSAAVLLGWLLLLVGNLVFGLKREGGKRLLVFIVGCGAAGLGIFTCRQSWPAFVSQEYPQALIIYLGIVFFGLGTAFLGASVFCSNETVRSCFENILRSL